MNIWLITIGEPLPIEKGTPRLLRTGIFADFLSKNGHNVTWWTSDFNHFHKHHHFGQDKKVLFSKNQKIILLHGRGYQSNVSLDRLRDHQELVKKFNHLKEEEPIPDIILSSHPTLGLCHAAIEYGKRNNIPVLIDIRDLWPDKFVELLPTFLRPFGRLILYRNFSRVKKVFAEASGIIGISPPILEWGLDYANRRQRSLDAVFSFGYPQKTYTPSELKEFDLIANNNYPKTNIRICFFGTLGRMFDFDTILKTASIAKEQKIDVQFIVCGKGDNFEKIKRQAKGLENVIFPGYINAIEIASVMSQSDLGLAPYIDTDDFQRTISNKIIEYLSGGLPVITSIEGYMGPFLKENNSGLTYKNNNPESLINIIKDLGIDKNKLSKMKKSALNLFNSRFKAEKVYNEYMNHLEMVTNVFNK